MGVRMKSERPFACLCALRGTLFLKKRQKFQFDDKNPPLLGCNGGFN